MEVRIKFSADVYIKGDNMAEIREKFESMPLFSADALEEGSAEYCETLLIEDADTYDDLSHEYYLIFDIKSKMTTIQGVKVPSEGAYTYIPHFVKYKDLINEE